MPNNKQVDPKEIMEEFAHYAHIVSENFKRAILRAQGDFDKMMIKAGEARSAYAKAVREKNEAESKEIEWQLKYEKTEKCNGRKEAKLSTTDKAE